jgi:hypothetical protein
MFEKIKSYGILLNAMEQGKCTREDITAKLLDEDLKASSSTFERLKRDLVSYYGIDIIYEKPYYSIRKFDNPNQRYLFQYIDLINEAEVFQEVLTNQENRNKVLVDEITGLKFQGLLGPIFTAIRNKKKISFSYYHFDERADRQITLRPYVLKQYENRWYVTGFDEDEKMNKTFGLDRISGLQILNDTFSFNEYQKIAKTYEETYGLNYSNELTTIKIKAFKPQYEYLERVPLHKSQQLKDASTQAYWEYEYRLRPNYEFEMALLRLSDQIEVLEPEWLRKRLKERLQTALNRHK